MNFPFVSLQNFLSCNPFLPFSPLQKLQTTRTFFSPFLFLPLKQTVKVISIKLNSLNTWLYTKSLISIFDSQLTSKFLAET